MGAAGQASSGERETHCGRDGTQFFLFCFAGASVKVACRTIESREMRASGLTRHERGLTVREAAAESSRRDRLNPL